MDCNPGEVRVVGGVVTGCDDGKCWAAGGAPRTEATEVMRRSSCQGQKWEAGVEETVRPPTVRGSTL